MSYNCESCKKHFWGAPLKQVLTTRSVVYRNKTREGEKVSHGYEIVKEADLCPNCYRRMI